MGSLFTAADVTGAGVLPGPAALVTSEAAPVTSNRDCSPQLGPSGLGSGLRLATGAERSRSKYGGRPSPTPSGATEDNRSSTFDLVDLDRDD